MVLPTARRHPAAMESHITTETILYQTRADNLEPGDFIIIEGRSFRISTDGIRTQTESENLHIKAFRFIIDPQINEPYPGSKHMESEKIELFLDPSHLVSITEAPKKIIPGIIQKNDVIYIKGRPGKIVNRRHGRSGKRCMIHVIALDVFTGDSLEAIYPPRTVLDCFEVSREDMLLLKIKRDGSFEVKGADENTYEVKARAEWLREGIQKFYWFYCQGPRENIHLCVVTINGERGVVGACTIWNSQISGRSEKGNFWIKRNGTTVKEGFLLLKGARKDIEMGAKMPTGEMGEIIKGLLKEGKKAAVKVRAAMGCENLSDGWLVVGVDSVGNH